MHLVDGKKQNSFESVQTYPLALSFRKEESEDKNSKTICNTWFRLFIAS